MSRLYSFVLPAYKARFFRNAIDSILSQTYSNWELIIVNDASPEDLDSIVNSYNDSRIHYYVNEYNVGGKDLVAQWNYCIGYAIGDYIILASDDDVYSADYLDQINSLVDKYPDVHIFRPRVQTVDSSGTILSIEAPLNEYTSQLEYMYLRSLGYVKSGIPYYVIRKDTLIENKGFIAFPIAWHSDDATVAIMARNGIATTRDVLFSFRISGESISSKENNSETLMYKLDATVLYYQWYREYVSHIVPSSTNDLFYKNALLSSINGKRSKEYVLWIRCSKIAAILSNTLTIMKHKVITKTKFAMLLLIKMFA